MTAKKRTGRPGDRARARPPKPGDTSEGTTARAAITPAPPVEPAPDASTRRTRRATKAGKEQLLVYLRPAGIKHLKLLAVEDDRSVSALVADAVNAYLRTRERSPDA